MNCKLTLKSQNGTEKTRGDVVFNGNAFKILYNLKGDCCLLSYDKKRVLQTRRGALSADMEFTEGEKTFCRIAGEGTDGTVEIFTERIAVVLGKAGLNLKLFYTLAGQKMRLDVTAEYR